MKRASEDEPGAGLAKRPVADGGVACTEVLALGGAGAKGVAQAGSWTPDASALDVIPFGMKLLVSAEEARCFRDDAGRALLNKIQNATQAVIVFSRDGMPYPATMLQEFNISGPTTECVVNAAVQLLTSVLDKMGALTCGEPSSGPNFVRIRTVLPSKAAAALIGHGGATVKNVRAASQMHVHIETTAIPPGPLGDLSEQVVSVDGPGGGVHTALSLIADVVKPFVLESFFSAWLGHSHCGASYPGLFLFSEAKGKATKSKGAGKPVAFKLVGKGKGDIGGSFGGMALKLLLAPIEGSCVVGKDGETIREIGSVTGTRLTLSGDGCFYPGTELQELRIVGLTHEAVVNAAMAGINKVVEESDGRLSGGQEGVEMGGARLKVAVPVKAGAAIAGSPPSRTTKLREAGLMIRVEEGTVPPGVHTEVTEQVLQLAGPCEHIADALNFIVDVQGFFKDHSWFESWANSSNTAGGLSNHWQPDLSLVDIMGGSDFDNGKGSKGKGKFPEWDDGKGSKGKGKFSEWDDGKGCKGNGKFSEWGDGKAFNGKGQFSEWDDGKGKGKYSEWDKGFKGKGKFSEWDDGKGGKGKGKWDDGNGKGKFSDWDKGGKGKRESFSDSTGHFGKGMSVPQHDALPSQVELGPQMSFKLLLAPNEVEALGRDPGPMRAIKVATNSSGMISEQYFPGSSLNELTVQGPTPEAVFQAVVAILNRIGDLLGAISSGDVGVAPGNGRVKMVVPKNSAAFLVGHAARILQDRTGICIAVDSTPILCADIGFEQAVVLIGPLCKMQPALEAVTIEVAKCLHDPWFQRWGNHSNTGVFMPGYFMFANTC